MLGAHDVRLAAEHEFSGLYPECETGAMAPFGTLYHQQVYADDSLTPTRTSSSTPAPTSTR